MGRELILVETIDGDATEAAIAQIVNAAVVTRFRPMTPNGGRLRFTRSTAALVSCDQLPGWMGTIEDAKRLCGARAYSSVSWALDHDRPCKGFMFRRLTEKL